jgi:polysaccharide biosynthesis protein PslA
MSQAALQRLGADLDQAPEAEPISETARDYDAIARLAELEAAFALFGVKTEQEAVEAVAEDVPEAGAETAYLNDEAPALEAANEFEPAAQPVSEARATLPALAARGVRFAPAQATRLIQAIDWIVVWLAAECAARWWQGAGLLSLTVGEAAAFLAAAVSLKIGLWITGVYQIAPKHRRAEQGAGGLALGAIAGLAFASVFAPDARAAAALCAVLPVAAALLAAIHGALAIWIRAAHAKGAFSETIVLVGATEAAERLAVRAAQCGDVRIVAIVDDRLSRAPNTLGAIPVAGSIDDLLAWDSLPHVDRIVIAVTQKAETRVRAMIERLRVIPNRVDLMLDYQTESVRGRRIDRLTGSPMACVSGRPHQAGRALAKRVQDIVFGASLLIAFAPLMALIALAVKLDSPGPALYRQRRHGFNNRIITILKFRTMRNDPGAPLRQVCANDPRITRFGRFLRRTSLDELPQLFNVLSGEMSLVGPRPHAVGMRAADRDLTHIVAEYAHRHRVKPGITGWAQVNGSRGPIDTPACVRERVKLDLHYVSNASFWLDLQIMLRTAPALFGDRLKTR